MHLTPIPQHLHFPLQTQQAQTLPCYINLVEKSQMVRLQVRSLHLLHHIHEASIAFSQFWKIDLHESEFGQLIGILRKWK